MSAQNETWIQAWLGLLGFSQYEPAAAPDVHRPCCEYRIDDQFRSSTATPAIDAERSDYVRDTNTADDTDCDY